MLYIILWFSIFIIFIAVFILFKFRYKKTKISSWKKEFFNKNIKRVKRAISNKEKIIEFDKIYHKILLEYWYEGTFWEVLKLKPKEIRSLNKIWELHKLRNKLVHDFDLLSEPVLKKKSLEYEKEINTLLI